MTLHAGERSVALADVATFIRGITFKPTDVVPEGTQGTVTCMRTKNVQSVLDVTDVWSVSQSFVKREDRYLRPGDVLIASANSAHLVGRCCWVPALTRPSTFGGFVSVLRATDPAVDARYLYWWFSSPAVQATLRTFGRQTTNIVNLDLARCRELRLPLPSLKEQRRIVEVLDRADALRTKRRDALALLDDLNQAIFLDLFGPGRGRRRWPIATLGELLAGIDSGKSPVCLSRSANDGEWGVLKLGAVSRRRYLPEQNKALPEGVWPAIDDEVHAGDLLMVRKNTLDHVGACALVGSTPPRLLLPDLIFRLRLRDQVPVRKRYLHRALCQDDVRAQIRSLAGGSAGSMPNISKARLSTVRLLIPPTELQDAFGARVELVEEKKAMQALHLDQIDALFAALQQRAFAGKL